MYTRHKTWPKTKWDRPFKIAFALWALNMVGFFVSTLSGGTPGKVESGRHYLYGKAHGKLGYTQVSATVFNLSLFFTLGQGITIPLYLATFGAQMKARSHLAKTSAGSGSSERTRT